MNWKETLVFPPEVPISERAKDLILRYVHAVFCHNIDSIGLLSSSNYLPAVCVCVSGIALTLRTGLEL